MPLWDINHPGIIISCNVGLNDGRWALTSLQLQRIASRPRGEGLLKQISATCQERNRRVRIKYTNNPKLSCAEPKHGNTENGRNGTGTSVVIVHEPRSGQYARLKQEYGNGGPFVQPFVTLAHELIHALHYLRGVAGERGDLLTGLGDEEYRTMGLGPYAGERYTENAIRLEWGLHPRTFYSTPNDCNGIQRQRQPVYSDMNALRLLRKEEWVFTDDSIELAENENFLIDENFIGDTNNNNTDYDFLENN